MPHKRRCLKLSIILQIIEKSEKSGGICPLCQRPIKAPELPWDRWEIDHIIPLSKGGTDKTSNLQLTHRSCNRRKKDKVR